MKKLCIVSLLLLSMMLSGCSTLFDTVNAFVSPATHPTTSTTPTTSQTTTTTTIAATTSQATTTTTVTATAEPTLVPTDMVISVFDSDCTAETYNGIPEFHVPQITLSSPEIDMVNQEIYNDYYGLCVKNADAFNNEDESQQQVFCVTYSYQVNGDILSLVIYESGYAYYYESYKIYNISLSDKAIASRSDVLADFSISDDEFTALSSVIMSERWTERCNAEPDEYPAEYDATMSHENLSQIIPFVGIDGELWMHGVLQVPAGSGYYTIIEKLLK